MLRLRFLMTSPKIVKLAELICPAFYGVHQSIKSGEYSEIWLKGGRGSTKSSFTAIEIILGIIADPDANAVVLRKVDNTLRTSVFTTLMWAINVLGVSDHFYATVSPLEITYKATKQKILLKGLDDPMKLKSLKAERGYFKYLWFEEAAEFNGMEELRNVEQSVLRGGERFIEFVTYNPPNDPAAWVNKESELKYPNRLVHTSDYLNVPRHWLGEPFFEKAERLKLNNYEKYQHEYLGISVGRSEQVIFSGKYEVRDFITPQDARFYHGVDWGFAQDPTTMIRLFIDDDCLYIDRELYGTGIEIDDLPAFFSAIETAKSWPIYADNSRPETISYVKRAGYDIAPSQKWSGCVEDGIEFIKSFKKIIIHPGCTHTADEAVKYSYKVDKQTQEILPIVMDAHNHCWDAVRYALDKLIKKKPAGFFDF